MVNNESSQRRYNFKALVAIFYTLEDIIFWTTSQNRGQITLSTTLMTTEMTPGVTYGLYYEQPFYLGDDSEILLYSYSWFNI